jgi:hypothetical protein
MKCKITCGPMDSGCEPRYTQVTWLYFYSQCSRIQQALGICSSKSGAYVPAITVCTQRLF